MKMKHKFVEFVPDKLEDGVLYVSIKYGTMNHNCPCGCGMEVVTPISPVDWRFTFDGETVSLSPSIGNWDYPCKSHYWIKKDKIVWAPEWRSEEIEKGRLSDKNLHELYTDANSSLYQKQVVRRVLSWLRKIFFGKE